MEPSLSSIPIALSDGTQSDGTRTPWWLTCAGGGCTAGGTGASVWSPSSNVRVTEQVPIGNLGNLPMETTAKWIDDPPTGTVGTNDALELSVKVWFTGNGADDDFNRVHLRALRS